MIYTEVLGVGFEPTNSKRLDLKTSAFDRFATLAK